MKKSFTLIEILLAIVIIGVLSTISVEIFAIIYKNYIYAKKIEKLESQTNLATLQIEKLLSYRIRQTLAIKAKNTNKNDFSNVVNLDNHCDLDCSLLWYMQSYQTKRIKDDNGNLGWSGFIDTTSINKESTPLSVYSPKTNIEKAFSMLKNKPNKIAIVFKKINYSLTDLYGSKKMDTISTDNLNTLLIDRKSSINSISEQYYLSHEANRLRVENGNLILDSFTPWINLKKIKSNILVQNVDSFRFSKFGYDGVIIKLCLYDGKNEDKLIVCKTKAVL